MLNKVHQEDETNQSMLEDQDWSSDMVRAKYINLDSIKSVLFTKLECTTSQRKTRITYKIDSGNCGNLMLFTIFKNLFLKAKGELLCAARELGNFRKV